MLMLYLVNFIDYEDEKNQTPILIKTDLPKEKVEKIIEKIIDESKKEWNNKLESDSLDMIVIKKLEEVFGKDSVVKYKYLKFYW